LIVASRQQIGAAWPKYLSTIKNCTEQIGYKFQLVEPRSLTVQATHTTFSFIFIFNRVAEGLIAIMLAVVIELKNGRRDLMTLACPNCHADMFHQVEPDIAIELCPQCGGRFLDQGELNELVTGLPGDIEQRSLIWTDMIHAVEGTLPQDKFPTRHCPVCEDQPMKKVGVTCGVDVVMDGCPECGGFFLDSGELESINTELGAESLDSNAEEIREERDGFLVRGNKFFGGTISAGVISTVGVLPSTGNATVHFQIVVYYPKPLEMGLHIFPEGWAAKITKAFGLYNAQDVETNDPAFDKFFIIRGKDELAIQRLLSEDVRQAVLRFFGDKAAIRNNPGSLEVHDHCVAYNEGPYTFSDDRSFAIDWQADGPAAMIDRVFSVARLISEGRD